MQYEINVLHMIHTPSLQTPNSTAHLVQSAFSVQDSGVLEVRPESGSRQTLWHTHSSGYSAQQDIPRGSDDGSTYDQPTTTDVSRQASGDEGTSTDTRQGLCVTHPPSLYGVCTLPNILPLAQMHLSCSSVVVLRCLSCSGCINKPRA